jgi:hypothetical protein
VGGAANETGSAIFELKSVVLVPVLESFPEIKHECEILYVINGRTHGLDQANLKMNAAVSERHLGRTVSVSVSVTNRNVRSFRRGKSGQTGLRECGALHCTAYPQ